jgi:hypothetical protein
MSPACPLIYRQVDATVTRINAFSVSAMVILFLGTSQPLWLYLLGTDFLIRLYGPKSFSPIHRLSTAVKHLLGLPAKMTDAGAKRLAAHFAVLFIILLLISEYLGLRELELFFGIVFVACAVAELIFDYCVGCKIYYLIQKIRLGA